MLLQMKPDLIGQPDPVQKDRALDEAIAKVLCAVEASVPAPVAMPSRAGAD